MKKKGGSKEKQRLREVIIKQLLPSQIQNNPEVIKEFTELSDIIATVILESGVISEIKKKWVWSPAELDVIKEKIESLLREKNKTMYFVPDDEVDEVLPRIATILSSSTSIHFLKKIGDIDIEEYSFKDVIPKKAKVYVILGMGCTAEGDMEKVKNAQERECKLKARNEIQEQLCETSLIEIYEKSEMKQVREFYANKFDLPIQDVFVLCETNLYKVVSRMAKQVVLGAIPYSDYVLSQPFDKSVEKTVNAIIQGIRMDNKVYVYGFSYGGSMANKLAMKLQAYTAINQIFMEKQKRNLIITTCGSPIIAEFETIKDINIRNYLHLGDGRVDWIHKQKEPALSELTERIDSPSMHGYWLSTVSRTNPSVTWIDKYVSDGIRFIDKVSKNKKQKVSLATMVHSSGYPGITTIRENEFKKGIPIG
jgi:hypothetical protein